MENIAKQLKDEIHSLEEYISRVENRFLTEHWANELLGPVEEVEDDLAAADLVETLAALVAARDRYRLDGPFSARLDAILQRHPELLGQIIARQAESPPTTAYEVPVAAPQHRPETAHELFEEEDEEISPAEDLDEEEDLGGEEAADGGVDVEQDDVLGADTADTAAFSPTAAEGNTAFEPILFAPDADEIEFALEGEDLVSGEDLFKPVNVDPTVSQAASSSARQEPEAAAETPERPSPDELFAASSNELLGGAEEETPDRVEARTRRMPRPERSRSNLLGTAGSQINVNPLDDKVGLEVLQEHMGFTLTRQDISQLQLSLQEQANGRKINALKGDEASAGGYILIPRVARFFHSGKLMDCTLKNLAKTYFTHFGNIQELTQYRSFSLLTSEVPETGWSLVSPEALSDSLGKNYMEQMQFLRQLASRVGLPSHLVRRRTLVEAVYDILVGKLVLKREVLRQTVDWTSSGPSKNDFICIYNAEEGIRLRDLARTSHHRVMGLCPNW